MTWLGSFLATAFGAGWLSMGRASSCSLLPNEFATSINYYVNPSQTHTLSFTVKGTVVTATADNHTFRSFTDTSGALSRASEIEFLFDYDSHTTLTVDLSNFVITALA